MNSDLLVTWEKYIDSHIMIDVYQYYQDNTTWDKQWLQKQKVACYINTRIFNKLNEEVAKLQNVNFPKLKEQIQRETDETIKDAYIDDDQPLKNIITCCTEKYEEMKQEKFSKNVFNKICGADWKKEQLNSAVSHAKIMYECGQYQKTSQILNCVVSSIDDDQLALSAYWGKLNSEIKLKQLDDAKQTIQILKVKVDEDKTFQQQHHHHVLNRAYLCHAALFVYLSESNKEQDYETFIELVTTDNNLAAIQMVCPHMIRYIASALLLAKNYSQYGNFNLQDFLSVINKKVVKYKDNLVNFLSVTLIDFDFENSENLLKQIGNIKDDFFLRKKANEILENAYCLFFETYCRIFDVLEIKLVASFLNRSIEEAEVWIVNLIRIANIEAKIDSENGQIHITKNPQNFNKQISHKLRDIIPRTNLLVNNLKRILNTKDDKK